MTAEDRAQCNAWRLHLIKVMLLAVVPFIAISIAATQTVAVSQGVLQISALAPGDGWTVRRYTCPVPDILVVLPYGKSGKSYRLLLPNGFNVVNALGQDRLVELVRQQSASSDTSAVDLRYHATGERSNKRINLTAKR